MPDAILRRALEPIERPTVTDSVFNKLHRQILSLELPPGTRMSESDVARIMDVSRQPVRDAFYRLSKLGFLTIRPQRATVVSSISERAVMQARFIRTGIEAETVRAACARFTDADIAALQAILDQQHTAVQSRDAMTFHFLDDHFHREICARSGNGFAWEIIRENKAHMDRVRFLTLSFASANAYDDHLQVFQAIKARDPLRAMDAMRLHLSRIKDQIRRIRTDSPAYFVGEEIGD